MSAAGQVNQFIRSATAVQGNAPRASCWHVTASASSAEKLRIPTSIVVTYLSAISYPLYLVHNVAGKTLIKYFAGVAPLTVLVPMMVVVVLAVSLAIHVLIEKWATPLMNTGLQRWLAPVNRYLARVA